MSAEVRVNGKPATEQYVQYEVEDGVATIWLNRPEVKNCVNWGLLTQLAAALERAEADDAARVVLIRGRGRTFCAGADLNMLDSQFLGTTNSSVKIPQVSARTVSPPPHPPPPPHAPPFRPPCNPAEAAHAVVEGHAVAGGLELLISCDFCIPADRAKIARYRH